MARRRPSTPGIDGVLLVDKPSGPTSHDVVAKIRRLAGQPRIGHGAHSTRLQRGFSSSSSVVQHASPRCISAGSNATRRPSRLVVKRQPTTWTARRSGAPRQQRREMRLKPFCRAFGDYSSRCRQATQQSAQTVSVRMSARGRGRSLSSHRGVLRSATLS